MSSSRMAPTSSQGGAGTGKSPHLQALLWTSWLWLEGMESGLIQGIEGQGWGSGSGAGLRPGKSRLTSPLSHEAPWMPLGLTYPTGGCDDQRKKGRNQVDHPELLRGRAAPRSEK